jgi:DNA-binding NarL/FixJ family response regulator
MFGIDTRPGIGDAGAMNERGYHPVDTPADVIRVLIVDDHEFVRAGLVAMLGGVDDLVVVGECAAGADVAGVAPLVRPDVVLMDVQMPRTGGIAAARELLSQQPGVRVVMLSGSVAPGVLADAAAAGAVGYLLKGDPNGLVSAIHAVAVGGTAWPHASEAGVT